jgi:glycosyltransferase involved in cell wall biosynthesis
LRIAHVVTYVSDDGAFGGPVAVAVSQARELAARGHQVTLLAGWDGKLALDIPNVDIVLFKALFVPGLGFSGAAAPGLTGYIRAHADEIDVLHIHAGRHAIALGAARLARQLEIPYLIQTHGMVMPDTRLKARVLDIVSTRPALRGASSILVLTEKEKRGVLAVSPDSKRDVRLIRNGLSNESRPKSHSHELGLPNVLFLARLHPRKRVIAFAEMAHILMKRGVVASFAVVGPDEGDLDSLHRFIEKHEMPAFEYEGPISPRFAASRLARASVYVLPSMGEVFPMTVLESLSVGTPVVLTKDCGIAEELSSLNAALVTNGSPEELADAVQSLIQPGPGFKDLTAGMRHAMSKFFSISNVADELDELYAASSTLR